MTFHERVLPYSLEKQNPYRRIIRPPPRCGALLPISTLPFGGNFKYAQRRLLLFSTDFTVDEAQKVANKVGIETGFPSIPTIRKAREEMGGGGLFERGTYQRKYLGSKK